MSYHKTSESAGVLPASYNIEKTKEFHKEQYEALCTNPWALAPSPYRLDHWQITVGDKLWRQRQRRADTTNRKARKKYERRLAKVAAENERIARLNRELQEKYLADLREYSRTEEEIKEARHARRRSDEEAKERRKKNEVKLHHALREELDSQEKNRVIEAALRDIFRRARWNALLGLCWPLWLTLLAIYLVLCLTAPMWAGIAAVPLFAVSRSFVNRHLAGVCLYKDSFWKPEHDCDKDRVPWEFWAYRPVEIQKVPFASVYTPLHFIPEHIKEKPREAYPLGRADEIRRPRFNVLLFLAAFIPGVSAISILYCLWVVHAYILFVNVANETEEIYRDRRNRLAKMLDHEFRASEVKTYLEGRPADFSHPPLVPPVPPGQPSFLPSVPVSPPPALVIPEFPLPPDHCYDTEQKGDYSHTLRGAMVYTVDEIRMLARYDLFIEGQIQPYFLFGGVPFPLLAGESASILIMGASGSGKSTIIRHLMSGLTPLTASQVRRILEHSPDESRRVPASSHEWSRSRVHQAVVYNAKEEYIPFLVGLGFNPDVDLFILDPSDLRCWCWDVATDINDRDSIAQFAVLLTPLQAGSENKKNDELWEYQARRIIEAVIISLRNAAFRSGKEPAWSLRDLREAVATPQSLREVLQFHDTPATVIAQLVDLSDAQKSSIFMSATAYISKIGTAAERWEEARRDGRVLSLKKWAKQMPGTVVVLPDSQVNEYFNGPINQILFKALTDLFVSHEYSAYFDSKGCKQYRNRYIFIDEFGEAGRLPGIKRLLSQGRSFGVRTVAGVHQLSQIQETYGEKLASSILGHFSYQTLLRTDDAETAEWMSKRIGDRLESYDKEQFQYGVSNGETFTTSQQETKGNSFGTTQTKTKADTEGKAITHGDAKSSSSSNTSTPGKPGTHTQGNSVSSNESTTDQSSTTISEAIGSSTQQNESTSQGTSRGEFKNKTECRTHSKELRGERTVLPTEFLRMPSPRKSKCIHGYYVTPDYPVWRAELPFAFLEPILEAPSALDDTPEVVKRNVLEDERVSRHKSWTIDDYKRLCITQSPSLQDAAAYASQSGPRDAKWHSVTPTEGEGRMLSDLSADFDFVRVANPH